MKTSKKNNKIGHWVMCLDTIPFIVSKYEVKAAVRMCWIIWSLPIGLHLTTFITSPINILLYFKNRKSNQHEIFTIAKSFNETNNHVKLIEKYFVVFTAFVRIWVYPQFQKLQNNNTSKNIKYHSNC